MVRSTCSTCGHCFAASQALAVARQAMTEGVANNRVCCQRVERSPRLGKMVVFEDGAFFPQTY